MRTCWGGGEAGDGRRNLGGAGVRMLSWVGGGGRGVGFGGGRNLEMESVDGMCARGGVRVTVCKRWFVRGGDDGGEDVIVSA